MAGPHTSSLVLETLELTTPAASRRSLVASLVAACSLLLFHAQRAMSDVNESESNLSVQFNSYEVRCLLCLWLQQQAMM